MRFQRSTCFGAPGPDSRTFTPQWQLLSPEAAGALPAFGLQSTLSGILVKRIHRNTPEKLKLLPLHSIVTIDPQELDRAPTVCKAQWEELRGGLAKTNVAADREASDQIRQRHKQVKLPKNMRSPGITSCTIFEKVSGFWSNEAVTQASVTYRNVRGVSNRCHETLKRDLLLRSQDRLQRGVTELSLEGWKRLNGSRADEKKRREIMGRDKGAELDMRSWNIYEIPITCQSLC